MLKSVVTRLLREIHSNLNTQRMRWMQKTNKCEGEGKLPIHEIEYNRYKFLPIIYTEINAKMMRIAAFKLKQHEFLGLQSALTCRVVHMLENLDL